MALLIYILILTAGSLYFAIKWWLKYWERRGLYYIKPKHPLDGAIKFGYPRHFIEYLTDIYKESKTQHKLYGSFLMMRPLVILQDVELSKRVMTTDSHYFQGRGMYANAQDDPLSAHLFNLEGEQWKKLREKLTSTFTSGKMKGMFPIVTKIADEMVAVIDSELKISNEIEVNELFARFTTDVIGNVAFGLDCNSLRDPNAKFREMGRKTLDIDILRQVLIMVAPGIAKKLHLSAFRSEITNFYTKVVTDTVRYREENNIERNDFMDLLIKLHNKEKSNDEADLHLSGLSINEIIAQAFIFFLAGFETSSSTMTFAIFELAQNQEIQELARKSVNEILARHKGEFSYEALNEMEYIKQCIDETLRRYPPAPFNVRATTSDWNVPDTDVIIKKGTQLWIPNYCFQNDPDYYPNPEVFDPDRFKFVEGDSKQYYGYMPFGLGPRNCIGLRFGLMQSRIGLAKFVQNYKFKLSTKTQLPLKLNNNVGLLMVKDGVYLEVEKI